MSTATGNRIGGKLLLSAAAVVLAGVLAVPAIAGGKSRISFSVHTGRYGHYGHGGLHIGYHKGHYGHHRRHKSHFSIGFHTRSYYRPNYHRHRYYAKHFPRRYVSYCPPPVVYRPVYYPPTYYTPYYGGGTYYSANTALLISDRGTAPARATVNDVSGQQYVYSGVATTSATETKVTETEVAAAPATRKIIYEPTTPQLDDGWDYLTHDRVLLSKAARAFAVEAERHPAAGEPKIGYAIAQSLMGNDTRAAWSIRRAIAYDVHALQRVEAKGRLADHLNTLTGKYEHRVAEGYSSVDDELMLAALQTMRGQKVEAGLMLAKAAERATEETRPVIEAMSKVVTIPETNVAAAE